MIGTLERKVSFLAGLLVCAMVLFYSTSAFAQAGVEIDANNVLKMKTFVSPSTSELRVQKMQAKERIAEDLRDFTPARAVSLTRLEQAVAKANGVVSDEVRYMAGLQRIDHVLVYPETGDVVLVGPAEGWYLDATGRAVGLTTGKPVLRLDDMVAAMRVFAPKSQESQTIGCSIDPTQEGLANLQNLLKRMGGTAKPKDTQNIVAALKNALGNQIVTVNGVAPETHFAKVLVEADYRMKLMGIGLEKIPVRGMKSFVESANPAFVASNALCRWYFVPDYECVRMSPDKLAISLEGRGVKLVGADEMVASDGTRKEAASSDAASRKFVEGFTKNYEKIADATPVYAELRNLIDMSVVAAFLRESGAYEKLGWDLVYFGNEDRFAIHTESAPKEVESAVSAVWRGNTLMTPIGGGVEIFANRALEQKNLISANDKEVAATQANAEKQLPEEGWWWTMK